MLGLDFKASCHGSLFLLSETRVFFYEWLLLRYVSVSEDFSYVIKLIKLRDGFTKEQSIKS